MHADKTTLRDLSIFTRDEEHSVFHQLDFSRTIGGKAWLRYYFDSPLETLKLINERQLLLRRIIGMLDQWPMNINNGTIMVLQKYFETSLTTVPQSPNMVSAIGFKLLNGPDFSLIDYTVTHFTEFIRVLPQLEICYGPMISYRIKCNT
jgi:DNA mismatch repair ATPase MutS